MGTPKNAPRARILTPALGLPSLAALLACLCGCGGGSRCVVTGYAPVVIDGKLLVIEGQVCRPGGEQ